MKRKIVLISLLIITLFLTGCTRFKKNISSGVKSVSSIVKLDKVFKNMEKQNSYKVTTEMKLAVDSDEYSFMISSNIDMESDKEGKIGYIFKSNMDGDKADITGYSVIKPNIITNYEKDASADYWDTTTTESEEYFKERSKSYFLDYTGIKYSRSEKLNDTTNCDVFSLSVTDISSINNLLGDAFDVASIDNNIDDYLSDIKFEMYVDFENNIIRRFHVDLTDALSNCFDINTNVYKYIITIDYTDFEEVEVSIPLDEIESPFCNKEDYIEFPRPENKFNFESMFNEIQYESNIIPLSFDVYDSVINPTKPVIYFVSIKDKTLYEVNYSNKEIRKTIFDLVPERVAYYNEKLYVTLLKGNHSSNRDKDKQEGAIAIVNANTMKIEYICDINIDPFDIEIDKEGYNYVSPGSGGFGEFCIYKNTGSQLDTYTMSDRNLIKYNEETHKIYAYNYSQAASIEVFSLSEGKVVNTYNHYLIDVELHPSFEISTDNKYIFNGSGVILNCSSEKTEDLSYKAKLKYSFDDVAFDLSKDTFYTSHGTQILKYDYINYDVKGYYNTYGTVNFLLHGNDSLIAISKDNNDKYYIEVIR